MTFIINSYAYATPVSGSFLCTALELQEEAPEGLPIRLTEAVIAGGHAFWSTVQSDGGDIRFYSDEAMTTRLPCYVRSIDTGTPSMDLYVQSPSGGLSTTDTIYLRVGSDSGALSQPAVGDPFGRNACFDFFDRYTFDFVTDVTGNGSFTQQGSPPSISGPYGMPGLEMNSVTGRRVESDYTTDSGPFTFAGFARSANGGGNWGYIFSKGGPGYIILDGWNGSEVRLQRAFTTTNLTYWGVGSTYANTWRRILIAHGGVEATVPVMCQDGVDVAAAGGALPAGSFVESTDVAKAGCHPNNAGVMGGDLAGPYYWKDGAVSAAWALAEFQTLATPSDFITADAGTSL
ncbi:MAG: hypothetical protein AB7P23_02400 [Amphiplicatus sp.]